MLTTFNGTVQGIVWCKDIIGAYPAVGYQGNVQRLTGSETSIGQYINLAAGSDCGCSPESAVFACQYGFNNGQPGNPGRTGRSDGIYSLSKSYTAGCKYDAWGEFTRRPSSVSGHAYVPSQDFWPGYRPRALYTWGTGSNDWQDADDTRDKDVMSLGSFFLNGIPGHESSDRSMTPIVGWRMSSLDAVATVCLQFTAYEKDYNTVVANAGMFFQSFLSLRFSNRNSRLYWLSNTEGTSVTGVTNWVWLSDCNRTKPGVPQGYGAVNSPTFQVVFREDSTVAIFVTAYVLMLRRNYVPTLAGDNQDSCYSLSMPSFAWKDKTLMDSLIRVDDSWIVLNPKITYT